MSANKSYFGSLHTQEKSKKSEVILGKELYIFLSEMTCVCSH